MKICEIISFLEGIAPPELQESYDNAGLLVGNRETEISSVLVTLDVTNEIIDEAIKKGSNFVISHHPLIFGGLKKITGKSYVERAVIKAIKNDVAIYSMHTNLDNAFTGVNDKICKKLGLEKCRILDPMKNMLKKLVTFVPQEHAEKVRMAIFDAGAGFIGNYDSCSYNVDGKGSFRALEKANPFVGEIGKIHFENEVRIEVVFPYYIENKIINSLKQSHPYEEVAFDIYPLDNRFDRAGMGMIGELPVEMEETFFLEHLKKVFDLKLVKHTKLLGKPIKTVAVCGGAGHFLLKKAIDSNAGIFISGDFKYHQFFDAENKIIIADVGHYESEQYTKELIYDLIIKKFANFAVYLSEVNTNPIHYF